ncbi:MAG: Rpn family recombination-promoting nuclease/putative transposase [Fibromonadales bacterium]|nr:Rpn family recombination-promoting nuclease/putative transposase [Fibromonadales bacterium]
MKFINSESKEEFMEFAEKSPVFEKAVDVLAMVSADEYNRMLYEARLKEWRDNQSRLEGAIKERDNEILDLIKKGYTAADIENHLRKQTRSAAV